jgi:pimeloyl-ACP methyl ester carboxylesterase
MPTTPPPSGRALQIAHKRQRNETDLHATEIGQGEPIVFIHGAFDPAEETFGKQKELADQYRVVLVDRRGYGESPRQIAWTSMLKSVVGNGAHLVGQSFGGLLCLLAPAAHPQAVWTLTVIEPTAMSVAAGMRTWRGLSRASRRSSRRRL